MREYLERTLSLLSMHTWPAAKTETLTVVLQRFGTNCAKLGLPAVVYFILVCHVHYVLTALSFLQTKTGLV